jgi:hypothetical protein
MKYQQKCESCKQAQGIRKECPTCHQMICSECWGKEHNAAVCEECEKKYTIRFHERLRLSALL